MAKANRKRANEKLKQPPADEQPIKHRPTAAEKEARISQVMTMLLSGARRIEIVQFGSKTWGVVSRQIDDYIAEATALIRASASKTREEEITEHIGRMDLIFRAAHGSGDYQSAIRAQQDKAKLRGLYPDQRIKVSTWKDEVVELLRDGRVTVEDVVSEFGDEGRQIVVAAGVLPDENGTPAGQGEQTNGASTSCA